MCTVSNIAYDWTQRHPEWTKPYTDWQSQLGSLQSQLGPSRSEFDALKAEFKELKDLLKAAKKYDDATGQKDCEQADKVALFKKLGELVGVDFEEVFEVKT